MAPAGMPIWQEHDMPILERSLRPAAHQAAELNVPSHTAQGTGRQRK